MSKTFPTKTPLRWAPVGERFQYATVGAGPIPALASRSATSSDEVSMAHCPKSRSRRILCSVSFVASASTHSYLCYYLSYDAILFLQCHSYNYKYYSWYNDHYTTTAATSTTTTDTIATATTAATTTTSYSYVCFYWHVCSLVVPSFFFSV